MQQQHNSENVDMQELDEVGQEGSRSNGEGGETPKKV